MKTLLIFSSCVLGALGPISPGLAQTVETTTIEPTEMIGTVTELDPEAIIIRSSEGSEPVRYVFNENTEYVDEAGNRVTREVVRSGQPVTIRYVREGGRKIASRVIVRKQTTTRAPAEEITTKRSTTTTTEE